MKWSDEEVQALREFAAKGYSAARTGVELEVLFGVARSKGAVIGELHRRKIAHGAAAAARLRLAMPESDKPRAAPPPAAPAAGPPHFLERQWGQCAWPLWGLGERTGHVCGAPVEANAQYRFCRDHLARCLR